MGFKQMTVAVETCDRCGRAIREVQVEEGASIDKIDGTSVTIKKVVTDGGEEKVIDVVYENLCPSCAGVVSGLIEKMMPVDRTKRTRKPRKKVAASMDPVKPADLADKKKK